MTPFPHCKTSEEFAKINHSPANIPVKTIEAQSFRNSDLNTLIVSDKTSQYTSYTILDRFMTE